MTNRDKYRIFLKCLLAVLILYFLFFVKFYFSVMIPEKMTITASEETFWTLQIPFFQGTLSSESKEVIFTDQSNLANKRIQINSEERIRVEVAQKGNYYIDYKLFGWLPVKRVELEAIEEKKLIPCGCAVGIYLKTNGILVIGQSEIETPEGKKAPADGILQSGDYILSANRELISSKTRFAEIVKDSDGKELQLRIRRGEKERDVKITPVQSKEGVYQLGVWVRDDTQGIGTMTYTDSDGHYGALGHGISDVDTRQIVLISDGGLYSTSIKGITKGSEGNPGTMTGIICYGEEFYLGSIKTNSSCGIFGSLTPGFLRSFTADPISVAYSQEVEPGEAVIYSDFTGEYCEYTIEIERINRFSPDNKELVLKVTDSKLLELTGGIVQGMSGSPILQNGKLVGAVTHVLVNDPTRGYGIFIENMLKH